MLLISENRFPKSNQQAQFPGFLNLGLEIRLAGSRISNP
jgi:hypothetical protein